jgi:sirohydrochlorin cobaltochelatase
VRAIILFAHGARDARWSTALAALRDRLVAMDQGAEVTTAFLEFQTPTLDEALEAALQRGASELFIVPVFWASGGHVLDDLPARLDAFRSKRPGADVRVLPVLSELPGLLDFVAGAVLRSAAATGVCAAS